jgi:DNA-binding LytR/AlgR family response regulator
MNRIKVLIADDEGPALNLVKSYVQQLPMLELVAECQNGDEALEALKNQAIDLLFLDIQMPGISGLELSKRLSPKQKVIFTTAFSNYALDGYKVDALDYLLKPFDIEEFKKAVLKAEDWFAREHNVGVNSFFVKTEYHLERIQFDDLLIAESDRDYVKLFLQNKTEISTLMTLKDLEGYLPNTLFMRIHRSFIVNLNKIDKIERNQVIIGNHRITIADSYKNAFNHYIQKHIL